MSDCGQIEITDEMIAAGRAVFLEWFALDEHQEGLIELPSEASISVLLSSSFAKMIAASPVSLMNSIILPFSIASLAASAWNSFVVQSRSSSSEP